MKKILLLICICIFGISSVNAQFARKVVMEEGTGTWCGWCTRGMVGMANMKAKYPNSFIGIAIHYGDPMQLSDYSGFINSIISGYPEMIVDRKTSLIGDPYGTSVETRYASEMAKPAIAGIEMTGAFTDASKNAIVLNTATTFGSTYSGANFKLAYVLLENGVTGYAQENYYAGGGSGPMGGYESKPATITDQVFDDVARGIYSVYGLAGSIPSSITAMTPVNHTYTITIPSNIQNKNNLEVVVMLLNAAGEIENADKKHIVNVGASTNNLSISTSSMSFGAAYEQRTFTISSNTNWTVSSSATWLTVSPSSGSNNGTITVTAAANTSTSSRTATITISGTGVTSQPISISQAGATSSNYNLSVSTNSLNYSTSSGQRTFTISSNTSWSVSSNVSWLSISPSSGSNNGTITVTAAANTSSSQRTATITVSGTGATSQTINVTQDGVISTLNVSTTSLSFDYTGGSSAFAITSNTNWSVSSNAAWLTVSPSYGSNDGTVTVSAAAYSDNTPRTATITVNGTGAGQQTINVTQDGVLYTLSVSASSLNYASSGSARGFIITSNTSWTVSSSAAWLTVSPTIGSNNATVTASVVSNPTTSPRTATITVSGTGAATKTINVTQEAPAPPPTLVPEETQQISTSGKGSLALFLSIPSSATLTGSFEIRFPTNMALDEEETKLAAELMNSHTLSYTLKAYNTWVITIQPSQLKSSATSEYWKVLDIAYYVNEQIKIGSYTATVSNINLVMNNNIPIKQDAFTVGINVFNNPTAVENIRSMAYSAYYDGNKVKIASPHTEDIYIYSISGVQLYSTFKNTDMIEVFLPIQLGDVLIIQGSKSGTLKVIKTH